MNIIHSTLDALRDRYAPISHTSTFRSTGQITPEEFVLAGDFLCFKFPSWTWSDASHPSKRASYLPDGKQFLVTRGVPCHRRLDDDFAGSGAETVVQDAEGGDGWLQTGGNPREAEGKVNEERDKANIEDVRTLDGSGNVGEKTDDDEEEIPDMEDEDDDEEAIIRETKEGGSSTKAPLRTYTLYITYTPYYRTPRFYLSGYISPGEPLPPMKMMEDIVGDYKDKTVTLEDFPFFDSTQSVKMASIHPCKHASVMKVLLDRADAALRLRRERVAQGRMSKDSKANMGMEGLVDETQGLAIGEKEKQGHKAGVTAAGGSGGDEWEVLEGDTAVEDDSAIRVDQYLVVFIKFIASVTPTIEHDFTMGV